MAGVYFLDATTPFEKELGNERYGNGNLDSFIDGLEFELRVKAEEVLGGIAAALQMPQPCCNRSIDIAKKFQVVTCNGLDDDLAMVFPSLDVETLNDLRISRSILPSRAEQADLMMENIRDVVRQSVTWKDEVKVNILSYAGTPLTTTPVNLKPMSVWFPLDLYVDELSDPPLLTRVDFKEPDGKVAPLILSCISFEEEVHAHDEYKAQYWNDPDVNIVPD